MINVLVGAVIGASINAGAYAAIQLWRGRPIQWKPLVAAGVGGVVAGALAGTTMGASLLAGTSTSATEFLAIDGALSSGTEKMTANALDHKALGEGVPEAAGWGAVTAPAAGVFLRGVGSEVSRLAQEAAAASPTEAAAAAAASATSDVAAAAATDAGAVTADKATTGAMHATVAAARRAGELSVQQVPTPSAHVLGNVIANAAFGSPWVGEGVSVAQEGQSATPVNPHASAAPDATPVNPRASAAPDATPVNPRASAAPPTPGIAGTIGQVTRPE